MAQLMHCSGPRAITPLTEGWRFRFEANANAHAIAGAFDDRSWEAVVVPHSWNLADATNPDGYKRGAGYYRLTFAAPARARDKRVYLEFDGAFLITTVWLNGNELGVHYGGFSRFRFDVTDVLRPNQENVLAVRVDNSMQEDTPPLEGDFTMFGGLYRHVRLIETSELAIDVLDHGSSGVYLNSTLATGEGTLKARVRVSNAGDSPRRTRIVVKVGDETETTADHLAPPGISVAELSLVVKNPRLWDGLKAPSLYEVRVELHEGDALHDRVLEPYGFRRFHVDPELGFFLNGKPYPLHGVGMHQESATAGWVVDFDGLKEDFRLVDELGASFVRVVHYQSHPALYDLCDELGFVVWAEQALINRASKSAVFVERVLLQMTELIRQNYNRPSIAFWGISNELQTRETPEAKALLERLAKLCEEEDPSRLSTLATNLQEPAGSFGEQVTAHNNYLGWYGGNFADFPPWLDLQRAKNPGVPMGLSEYGAGAGPHIHYDCPAMMDHSEEYQCLYHEAAWEALRTRPWLFCTAIWDMFDFASAGRAEGESLGINDKGLVTRDRKLNKDAFYFYKAQWSREPFVYIASRRFVARTLAQTTVKIYSNQAVVELQHNGKSLGTQPVKNGTAVFPEVTLTPWANRMVARSGTLEDVAVWILNVYYNPWV